MDNIILANPTPAVKPLPKTAAERVRELALTHQSICRYRRQGLACSTCHDLMANATRLWLKSAEMKERAARLEAARLESGAGHAR